MGLVMTRRPVHEVGDSGENYPHPTRAPQRLPVASVGILALLVGLVLTGLSGGLLGSLVGIVVGLLGTGAITVSILEVPTESETP